MDIVSLKKVCSQGIGIREKVMLLRSLCLLRPKENSRDLYHWYLVPPDLTFIKQRAMHTRIL